MTGQKCTIVGQRACFVHGERASRPAESAACVLEKNFDGRLVVGATALIMSFWRRQLQKCRQPPFRKGGPGEQEEVKGIPGTRGRLAARQGLGPEENTEEADGAPRGRKSGWTSAEKAFRVTGVRVYQPVEEVDLVALGARGVPDYAVERGTAPARALQAW